jgi:hypothetical protein
MFLGNTTLDLYFLIYKSNIYWKTPIIYLKVTHLIKNAQVPVQTYFLKFLNMCKFVHDRKTHFTKQILPESNFLTTEPNTRWICQNHGDPL